jgi:predicted metallopeptidase
MKPIASYAWATLDAVPSREVRVVTTRRKTVEPIPPWIDTGDREQPFHFSQALQHLCADIAIQSPHFRHLEVNRILFTYSQARNHSSYGLQARVTPLRFRNGRTTLIRRGQPYRVQGYSVAGIEMLYLVDFCLPRFLDRSFEDKLITLFHELHHISPKFNGDLRRHPGRYQFHTGSQKAYDRQMAALVRDYLSIGANPSRYDFLRVGFDPLRERHGSVIGYRVPRPKVIRQT